MKKLISTTVIFMSLLLTMPAFASGPDSGKCTCDDQDFGYHHSSIWQKLNLSDEQRNKIDDLWISVQKEIRPLREKMYDKSMELRRLWLQASPDKDKIEAAQKELRKLRDSISDKITSVRLQMRKILTPEQNKKLADSRWGSGMGYGPRGGDRGPNAPCPGGYF